jgi:hypothetical protein
MAKDRMESATEDCVQDTIRHDQPMLHRVSRGWVFLEYENSMRMFVPLKGSEYRFLIYRRFELFRALQTL